MTQSVGIDENGGLWTTPGVGGISGEWKLVKSITLDADVSDIIVTTDDDGNPLNFKEGYIEWYNPTSTIGSTAYIQLKDINSASFEQYTLGSISAANNPVYGLWFFDRLNGCLRMSACSHTSKNKNSQVFAIPELLEKGVINYLRFRGDGRDVMMTGAIFKLYAKE
jgi:hypothetical protein